MTVSILGCGWYGKALAAALKADGHLVKGSVTSEDKLALLAELGIEPFMVNFEAESAQYNPDFFSCDVLVISIPPRTRYGEGSGYLRKINRVIEAALTYNVRKMIYISSTAVYAENCGVVTEADLPEPGTEAARILVQAEHAFEISNQFTYTVIRFGGLVGPGRHPGRFFAGKVDVPNGGSPVNLIHLADCIGITLAVLPRIGAPRVINAVSPHHPQKAEYYRQASLAACLLVPAFRDEMTSCKIVNSCFLADDLGYTFQVANWNEHSFN